MKTAEEFKGTNGEWKIQEPYNTFVYGSDGKLICQIKYDPFSEESIANAQLIAAAPELLKALQNLMKGVEGLPPLTVIAGLLENEYREAEKAINKAFGK